MPVFGFQIFYLCQKILDLNLVKFFPFWSQTINRLLFVNFYNFLKDFTY